MKEFRAFWLRSPSMVAIAAHSASAMTKEERAMMELVRKTSGVLAGILWDKERAIRHGGGIGRRVPRPAVGTEEVAA